MWIEITFFRRTKRETGAHGSKYETKLKSKYYDMSSKIWKRKKVESIILRPQQKQTAVLWKNILKNFLVVNFITVIHRDRGGQSRWTHGGFYGVYGSGNHRGISKIRRGGHWVASTAIVHPKIILSTVG